MAETKKLSKKQEEELVSEVWNDYRYAMQKKAPLHKKWRKYEEFYKNDQWKQIKVDKDRIKPTINYIFTTVESLMPYLTSNVPDPIVLPTNPDDEEKARDLTKITKIILNKNGIEKALQIGERERLKFGTCIWKVFFDPHKLNGLGDVAFEIVDPVNFFIDPNEVDDLQNADFCGTAVKRSIEYLKKRYPEKANEIIADQMNDEISVYDSEDEEDPRNRQATLIEYWKKDKDDGLIRIVVAGNVLLSYDKNFYMHGKYPFVRGVNYPIQKSFWGMGEAEQLVEMQVILNKLLQLVIENVALANGQFVVDKNASGIRDIKSLANKLWQPGLTIPVNDINSIKKLDGVLAPGWVVNLIQMIQKNIELVTGVSPLYLGEAPGSVTAASGILALQEQATARVKLKLQEQGRMIEEIVKFVIAYIVEFYTEDRYFRILNENREPEWIEMSRDDVAKRDEDGNLIIPEFDVSIEVGFDAPMSRAYIEQMAMQLYQMGVINSVEVLKTMNFPNKEEIIERLEQVSELQGQMAGLPEEMISPSTMGELAQLTALDIGNPTLPGGMNAMNTNSPQDALEQQEQMSPEQLF